MEHAKRNIVVFLLVIVLLGLAAWFAFHGRKQEQEDVAVPYVIEEVPGQARLILARGILQCAETTPAIVGTSGRITDMRPQGSPVKKGDILFQIDDASAREDMENQEANLHNSELSLVKLHTSYDLIEFQETQTLEQRKAQLDHAILEEKMELAEPLPRDCRLMEIEEELAALNLADAQDNYDREYRLFKKDYISASALEPYEQKLENSKATQEELLLQNKLTRKGVTDERRVELRMAVKRAQANMERREKRKQRRLDDASAQIKAEELNGKTIRHIIEHYKTEISRAVVTAKTDGVFKIRTYRDWASGGLLREIAVGEEKRPQDVVGDVIDPTRMVVKLVVNEADYHYLQDDMDVSLEMPAIVDKSFRGKLRQLGAIGRDRNRVDPTAMASGDSEVSMFNAAITFDGEGVTFHPGMSSLIRIIVKGADAKRVLVPRAAVANLGNGAFQVQLADGTMREIQGYYFNDNYFEVASGLEMGETVLIYASKGVVKP